MKTRKDKWKKLRTNEKPQDTNQDATRTGERARETQDETETHGPRRRKGKTPIEIHDGWLTNEMRAHTWREGKQTMTEGNWNLTDEDIIYKKIKQETKSQAMRKSWTKMNTRPLWEWILDSVWKHVNVLSNMIGMAKVKIKGLMQDISQRQPYPCCAQNVPGCRRSSPTLCSCAHQLVQNINITAAKWTMIHVKFD